MKGRVQVQEKGNRVTIRIPMRTRNVSNDHRHWSQLHGTAKAQRVATRLCVAQPLRRFQGVTPLFVRMTRIAPRRLDEGTVMEALKHVRDGVADALGITDTGRDGVAWLPGQERGGVREYAVKIEVWTEEG